MRTPPIYASKNLKENFNSRHTKKCIYFESKTDTYLRTLDHNPQNSFCISRMNLNTKKTSGSHPLADEQ
jgi:hypothetical protein